MNILVPSYKAFNAAGCNKKTQNHIVVKRLEPIYVKSRLNSPPPIGRRASLSLLVRGSCKPIKIIQVHLSARLEIISCFADTLFRFLLLRVDFYFSRDEHTFKFRSSGFLSSQQTRYLSFSHLHIDCLYNAFCLTFCIVCCCPCFVWCRCANTFPFVV